MPENDRLSEKEISLYLKTDIPLYFETETASTNDLAKAALFRGTGRAAFVAARQTGGRGRMGRRFSSPEGGVYLSVLLPLCSLSPDETVRLTTAACVAVRSAIRDVCGIETGIKWVNDLYYNGRKVCGILCEGVTRGEKMYCVVGVGINLLPPAEGFDESIRDTAGSLFERDAPPRAVLAAAVIDALADIESDCRIGGYIATYRRHSLVLNKRIVYTEDGAQIAAVAEDIDENGGLIVLVNGERRTLTSGEVSVKLDE